jgi:hypothetical protein
VTNPSRPGQTSFWDDYAKLKDVAATYVQGVREGRWATPGQRSTDSASYDPINQTAGAAAGVVNAVTPRFGTDWDVQGFKQDVSAGNYGTAGLRALAGTAGAAADVIDPGTGHMLTGLATAALPAAGKRIIRPGEITGHWDDLSKIKSAQPYEEMTAGITPTRELQPQKVVTPEQLEGGVMIPLVGDRTQTGGVLHSLNERTMAYPVSLEGGPDFQRGGQTWASEKAQTSAIARRIREAQETGRPVFTVYTSMGARSGDFSHHNADALVAQIPGAKITRDELAAFDKKMRETYPQFAGVRNPQKLHEQLYEPGAGGLRSDFVKEMDKTRWQEKGFPSVAATRWATTVPELRGQPTGVAGRTISRFDRPPEVNVAPAERHSTYPTTLERGQYIGGFEHSVPRDLMWRDWANQRAAQGLATTGPTADRSIFMSDVSQIADPKWVDQQMNYLRQLYGQ